MQKGTYKSFSLLFIIVILNYMAQIPYDIHLYAGRFNPIGAVMLVGTLLWFLIGFNLVLKQSRMGYWLLFSFLVVQFLFYFHGQIILMLWGYGLFYHLLRFNDMILWWVFFIGDVNFFTAAFYIYYLWKKRKSLIKNHINKS